MADLSIKTVLSFFRGIQIIATIINFLFSILKYLFYPRFDFELNFVQSFFFFFYFYLSNSINSYTKRNDFPLEI